MSKQTTKPKLIPRRNLVRLAMIQAGTRSIQVPDKRKAAAKSACRGRPID